MNWMIYPAAKAFIRACTFLFGAGVTATVLIHLFMPLFLHCPRTAAPFLLLGTWSELISILALSFLLSWGSRVLLASQGSRITRILSALAFLPALYSLLIPFAGMPVLLQYAEMDRVWESFLLLAAIISFFSFPYTADTDPQAEGHSWPGALRRQAADCKASCSSSPPCCGSACPPWLPPWQRQLRGWPLSCPAASKSC